MSDEVLFTPAAVLEFLTEVDELKDRNISMEEKESSIDITIGDTTYSVNTTNSTEVQVDEEVIDVVDEENSQAYDDIVTDNPDIQVDEVVESGLLSGIAKSLLLGGMIRLAPKLLK